MPPLRWDLFCRVVDNHGDAGVCWRLAADLAARGDRVRLVIDDAAPLGWMAPAGAPGVQVLVWPQGDTAALRPEADVVVEAFGCDPPAPYVAAMAALAKPPVWLNLEYLSAEAYVERSHGLPSPQRNGLTKWFFYPGFTAATGGLLREPWVASERAVFDRHAWLLGLGLRAAPDERVVSLFCYDNPALPALLAALGEAPTLLLLTPGPAQRQVAATPPGVRVARLPFLTQRDFDRLLWASELNFVRGEDSLVRALWAGAPFVWQAYPQHDGAHFAKLEALLSQAALPEPAARLWRAWNGAPGLLWPGLPAGAALAAWRSATSSWHDRLSRQDDLAVQLRRFALGESRICG